MNNYDSDHNVYDLIQNLSNKIDNLNNKIAFLSKIIESQSNDENNIMCKKCENLLCDEEYTCEGCGKNVCKDCDTYRITIYKKGGFSDLIFFSFCDIKCIWNNQNYKKSRLFRDHPKEVLKFLSDKVRLDECYEQN